MTAYRWIEASAPLLVEHAWVLRDEGGDREVLLPDGRGLLQLVVGAPGVRTDVLTGEQTDDASGVRGFSSRAVVREQLGPAVRLGLQLHPLALALLRPHDLLVDRCAPPAAVVDEADAVLARDALAHGDDEDAVRVLVAALVARSRTTDRPAGVTAMAEVVAEVDRTRGLVAAADLARAQGVTVSDLHRWCVRLVGVAPASYLAAVRFAGFVREAAGPGPVSPRDVVGALQWYESSGPAPREVERTTGLAPAELRRVVDRLALSIAAH